MEGIFNASVGMNAEPPGVCGKLGLGRVNDAGRDLIKWCEQHQLQYSGPYTLIRVCTPIQKVFFLLGILYFLSTSL